MILCLNLVGGEKSEVGFWVCDHVTLARAAVFEPGQIFNANIVLRDIK